MDPVAWVVACALTGFCFAGLFIVVESWLNSAATGDTRGQILSIYAMTGLLAGIVGQLLLPATDPAGFRAFCIVAIIIAFALVPIALTRASRHRPMRAGRQGSASEAYIGSRRSASWPPSCAEWPQALSSRWARSSRNGVISILAESRRSWRAVPWAGCDLTRRGAIACQNIATHCHAPLKPHRPLPSPGRAEPDRRTERLLSD
jgi:MFS family permease